VNRHECVVLIGQRSSFPLSFERTAEGACPVGWTCTKGALVCAIISKRPGCMNPHDAGAEGRHYFAVGSDLGVASAQSLPFVLPAGIDRICFRRSGGADFGSGLYLISQQSGLILCRAETGTDTNMFFDDYCRGLAGLAGETVYIELRDSQRSGWGKVLIDDIHLQDVLGRDLDAMHLGVTPWPAQAIFDDVAAEVYDRLKYGHREADVVRYDGTGYARPLLRAKRELPAWRSALGSVPLLLVLALAVTGGVISWFALRKKIRPSERALSSEYKHVVRGNSSSSLDSEQHQGM